MTSYLSRQRQPSGAQTVSPSSQRFPSIAEPSESTAESPKRRPSFNFLSRAKSVERFVPGSRKSSAAGAPDEPSRKASNGKLSKRSRSIKRKQEMEREQIPPHPPQIPQVPRPPHIQSFGGEDARPDSVAIMSGQGYNQGQNSMPASPLSQSNGFPKVPVPPIPVEPRFRNYSLVDPYARTESMTHRGRYSYASSMVSTVNGPRRVRRRKDPAPFNVLIIGARNSGKTSFLNFLKDSLAQQARKPSVASQFRLNDDSQNPPSGPSPTFPSYTSHYLENEIDGERIGITLWDSKGLEAHILDLQLREMSSFIESKFEETFSEENKVVRSPGVRDTHIHCVLFLLDPSRLDSNLTTAKKKGARKGMVASNGNSFFDNRSSSAMAMAAAATHGGLDENLELQVLRALQGKTTVVPVISKADKITGTHMRVLKRAVYDSIKQADLDTLSALGFDDAEDLTEDDDEIGQGTSEDSDVLPSRSKTYDNHLTPDEQRPVPHQHSLSNTSHLSSPSNSSPSNSSSPASFKTDDFDIPNPPGSGLPPTSSSSQNPTTTRVPLSSATPQPEKPPFIPLSIISPDPYEPEIIGRKFPWGFADPMDKSHCDFIKLKESVFEHWRTELKEVSTGREGWYEAWRTDRLAHGGGGAKVANAAQTAVGRGSNNNNGNGNGNGVVNTGIGIAKGNGEIGEQQQQQRQQVYGRAW